jgi:hypothetical protein
MNTVHLQGIGLMNGKKANELEVGDITVWNYGYLETVVEIIKETAKTITVMMEYKTTLTAQRQYSKVTGTARSPRRFHKDTIIAITRKKEQA